MRRDPFIDRPVGRSGIESEQGTVSHAGRNIRHTAKVQHGARPVAGAVQQCAMIDRRQRRAVSSGGHVSAPEIVSERDAKGRLQCDRIDQLQGRARCTWSGAPVENRLPMYAGQWYNHPLTTPLPQYLPHLCMGVGNHLSGRFKCVFRRRAGPVPGPRRIRRIL